MNYNIKEILQKFWFVILVGVIFISMAVFFAWDTHKDTISAKSVDGKDVIFTLNDKNYTADEYYKELFNKATTDASATPSGVQLAYMLIERQVVSKSVKATDKMESDAEALFNEASANFKQQYGNQYEVYLDAQLKPLGYSGADELEEYYLDQAKSVKLISDYIDKHKELFDEVYEKESPRVLSNILVKMADSENPTDTEKKKMEAVDKALETDDFGAVAKKYSDDNNAADKGSLGITLQSGTMAQELKDAAWKLKDGEVSGWVKSESGYYKFKLDTADKAKMVKDKAYKDSLTIAILTHYPNLQKQIIWENAKKLKIDIKDKTLKADLLKFIGVEE